MARGCTAGLGHPPPSHRALGFWRNGGKECGLWSGTTRMGVLAQQLCDRRQVTSLSVPQPARMIIVPLPGLRQGMNELLTHVRLRRVLGHSKCSVSDAGHYDFPGLGPDKERTPEGHRWPARTNATTCHLAPFDLGYIPPPRLLVSGNGAPSLHPLQGGPKLFSHL